MSDNEIIDELLDWLWSVAPWVIAVGSIIGIVILLAMAP